MARSWLPSLLAKAAGDIARVAGGLWPRYNGWGWGRGRLYLPSARFDWEREAGDPWMNSTVALGISWLGDRFPRPKVQLAKIARNGDQTPIGRSPHVDLWQRPNPYYTRRTMERAIGLSLKTDGNAYIYKLRDRAGRVCQLWWLPHFRVNPTWPSDGSAYVDGYRVRVDTHNYYHLPPEDVIHIRDGIDPWNERLGLASLKATLREVVSINLAAGYTAALLKNSGVPGLAIIPDGPNRPQPDADAARRMKQEFVEKFSGDMAGSPIVFNGPYKLVEVGFSPEKLGLSNLTRDAEARVAAAVGVAAMSLGLPDPNKTYSNLGEANRASWGTVVSLQELVSEGVRFGLLPEPIAVPTGTSPGLDPMAFLFTYDYSEIQEMQESLDAIHMRTRNDFRFDLIRRNEAREELGYEPDPDGDVYFSEIQLALAVAKAGGAADEPTDTGPGDAGPHDAGPSATGPTERAPRPGKALALTLTNGEVPNGHGPRWQY